MKIAIHEVDHDPNSRIVDRAFGDNARQHVLSCWRFLTCSFPLIFYTHTRSPAREGGMGYTNPDTPTCVIGQGGPSSLVAAYPAILINRLFRYLIEKPTGGARGPVQTSTRSRVLVALRAIVVLAGIGIIDL